MVDDDRRINEDDEEDEDENEDARYNIFIFYDLIIIRYLHKSLLK